MHAARRMCVYFYVRVIVLRFPSLSLSAVLCARLQVSAYKRHLAGQSVCLVQLYDAYLVLLVVSLLNYIVIDVLIFDE